MEEKRLPAGSTEIGAQAKGGGAGTEIVLRIEDLHVHFVKNKILEKRTVVKAVDGVSLELAKGEILSLVGESGSGKTTLGRAVIGLVRPSSGRIVIVVDGAERDIGGARGKEWKRLRAHLQIVFQDPFSSIDPNMRVYDALRIPLQSYGVKGQSAVAKKISDVMRRVGLPEQVVNNYIFQLSGGQRQRIGIARVLLFDPSVIIADEPVSMLDASLKGDILNIIERESKENGVTFLFITHDMAVAKVVARRIAVMYLGKIVELGLAEDLLFDPLHPYTKAMLQASPAIDPSMKERIKNINIIGELAKSTDHPSGCKFNPRCPFAMDVCREKEPPLKEVKAGHQVACWLY
ncbi:MAG: ABC transporter ATP-binding protein [Thaumarchaeota archaeon]|nr:ABC transporter ATP-binding protein [Nitrososphaerota archaeon]